MTRDRANFLSYLFILVTVAVAAYLYRDLPDPMPTDWNPMGKTDGYLAKPWGVIVLPLAPILVFFLIRLVPVFAPRRSRTQPFRTLLNLVQVGTVAFISFGSVLFLLHASGVDVHINQIIFAAIGIVFIIAGQYVGAIRKDFLLGIRTPWTLTSEEVWARTHRMAGRFFIGMGLVCLFGALYQVPPEWVIGMVLVLAFVPVVYSWFLYRQEEGAGGGRGGEI